VKDRPLHPIVVALLVLALAPGLSRADEAMPTAPAHQSPPAAAGVSPLQEADVDAPDGGSGVRLGPCGPEAVAADGKTETKAHGYIEGGVGTNGYRHIAAGLCKPLANGGAIAVSVSQSQAQGRR
jgi:hypothetical protein